MIGMPVPPSGPNVRTTSGRTRLNSRAIRPIASRGFARVEILILIIEQRHLADAEHGGRGAQLRSRESRECRRAWMVRIARRLPAEPSAVASRRGQQEHVDAFDVRIWQACRPSRATHRRDGRAPPSVGEQSEPSFHFAPPGARSAPLATLSFGERLIW